MKAMGKTKVLSVSTEVLPAYARVEPQAGPGWQINTSLW